MKKKPEFALQCILCILIICLLFTEFSISEVKNSSFDSLRAFTFLAHFQSLGPRIPGSDAHSRAVEFLSTELQANGWVVEIQSGSTNGHAYKNIVAIRGTMPIKLLLASHYDSRMTANHDPNPALHSFPVPGANDGGSSTAVLVELSRTLPREVSEDIGLVFFDIEDQGNIEGWDWILGSREFVSTNKNRPDLFVLLDMVGGYDQIIQPPVNSDRNIYLEIQSVAHKLSYEDHFVDPSAQGILDDHVPFLDAGVPSVDLIDIIDPRWHTTTDDIENVSLASLQRIGDTLTGWILSRDDKSGS
jgi:glutaminyl-peptide cyclotransferase